MRCWNGLANSRKAQQEHKLRLTRRPACAEGAFVAATLWSALKPARVRDEIECKGRGRAVAIAASPYGACSRLAPRLDPLSGAPHDEVVERGHHGCA